jgi:hypothetical protein
VERDMTLLWFLTMTGSLYACVRLAQGVLERR